MASTLFYFVILCLASFTTSKVDHCSRGQKYWCKQLSTATNCNAVRHCMQNVWEKTIYPEDKDSVCKICLDMVKQARDQLQSNQTLQDIKAVLEGSCKLIPINEIKKKCIDLADEYGPELVQMLSSEMDPQTVCSVAGLCNNAKIDEIIKIAQMQKKSISYQISDDRGCLEIAEKLNKTDHQVIKHNMLEFCRTLSSFSDACSNIITKYFENIYSKLYDVFSSKDKFFCGAQEENQRIDLSSADWNLSEDISCEFCEQLVKHFADIMTVNTTKNEFKTMLLTFCNQTGNFKEECSAIVNEYYFIIYKTLLNDLDGKKLCSIINICPKTENIKEKLYMPLLEEDNIKINIEEVEKRKKILGETEPKLSKAEIESMQLPIDKLLGAPLSLQLVKNGKYCKICNVLLYYLQKEMASPMNEEKIENLIHGSCNKLPETFKTNCDNFVTVYGSAIVAMLIQGIDPKQVCPALKMCPKIEKDVEIFAPKEINVPLKVKSNSTDSPLCSLCLFTVTEAQEIIKQNNSKEYIKKKFEDLCNRFSNKEKTQCIEFVDTYLDELVQKLNADFTAQEICVSLKICPHNRPDLSEININVDKKATNIKPTDDYTLIGQDKTLISTPKCMFCQTIIKKAESQLINNKSEEKIINVLEHVCTEFHKLKDECNKFVKDHTDQLIKLILSEVNPKEICAEIGYCIARTLIRVKLENSLDNSYDGNGVSKIAQNTDINIGPTCPLCKFIVDKLEHEILANKTEKEIEEAALNACRRTTKSMYKKCQKFIDEYGKLFFNVIGTVAPDLVCQTIFFCDSNEITEEVERCGTCHGTVQGVSLEYQNKTYDGDDGDFDKMTLKSCQHLPPKYFTKCSTLLTSYGQSILYLLNTSVPVSDVCAEIGMCLKEQHSPSAFVKLTKKTEVKLIGQEKCTWGPSYWCSHEDNAQKCGATSYCLKKQMEEQAKLSSRK